MCNAIELSCCRCVIASFFYVICQALRTESAVKYDELSAQLEDLKHKKRITSDVVKEAERRNDEIKEQLKSNENYRHISHLEEKLSDLIEDTKDTTIVLDQLHKVSVYMDDSQRFVICASILISLFFVAGD